MKIAIFTQPIYINYGGILQAYAVQKVLKDMGHQVVTIDIPWKVHTHPSVFLQLYQFFITFACFLLGRIKFKDIFFPFNTKERNTLILRHSMRPFINRIIKLSPPIFTDKDLVDYIKNQKFDACIVGSDQVWRPCYSPNIGWYFFDFLSEEDNIKRLALSASFGTSDWEYTDEQTEIVKRLLNKFDAISVREKQGLFLCKKKLGIDVIQLIDPTMMLSPKDYSVLVEMDKEKTTNVSGLIFAYILDPTDSKQILVTKISRRLKKEVNMFGAEIKFSPYAKKSKVNHYALPSVSQWLQCFQYADFVITDSFHGVVFSILHHRPFIVIANKERGLARIESILEMFDLQDRLLDSIDGYSLEWLINGIDWEMIDGVLELERQRFRTFLIDSLS